MRALRPSLALPTALALLAASCSAGAGSSDVVTPPGAARVGYLHHSTGGVVWGGGVADLLTAYNGAHGTSYTIEQRDYPLTANGYPWDNYPYDYWNLWVAHTGSSRDRQELNLDDLAALYDVIVFKHCFPVSDVAPDGTASVSSAEKTLPNYKLQYAALKTRLHAFPQKKFLVWTGSARKQGETSREHALRAQAFADWVKGTWDVAGDNIFVWDFRALETAGSTEGLYLNDAYSAGDSHPDHDFAVTVAPYFVRRLTDVIEGRGDGGSLTGQ
ncbi:MAG: hypothetical protein QM767_29685 [Anaeromyxobacter sp.]